jgi:hypothetical protein
MLRLLRKASDRTTNKMPQINTDLVFAPQEPAEKPNPPLRLGLANQAEVQVFLPFPRTASSTGLDSAI